MNPEFGGWVPGSRAERRVEWTEQQLGALTRYFCEKTYGSVYWYHTVNTFLRTGECPPNVDTGELRGVIGGLESAFEDPLWLIEDVKVYRGVRGLAFLGFNSVAPGYADPNVLASSNRTLGEIRGYFSTSADYNVARKFAGNGENIPACVLGLTAEAGIPAIKMASLPIADLHGFGEQQEWLFGDGTTIHIDTIDYEQDLWTVEGRIL
jgi:ADP-ribosyltransferase exoenzyme